MLLSCILINHNPLWDREFIKYLHFLFMRITRFFFSYLNKLSALSLQNLAEEPYEVNQGDSSLKIFHIRYMEAKLNLL